MKSYGADPGPSRDDYSSPLHGDSTPASATEDTFEADVIGVDVIGFSRFTQRLITERGVGASEQVTDVLDAGFRAIAERLRDDGFSVADSLGDGIVLARPQTQAAELAHIVRRAEQAFVEAVGSLRIRTAYASGRLSICRIGGLQQRWDVVATGPAIEALHAAMRQKRRIEPLSFNEYDKHGLPALPSAQREARSFSEIRRLAVAFVVISPPPELLNAPLAPLQDAAALGQRLAEACGGRLEKVSHDEKGLLFDFTFARARGPGVTALDSALDFVAELRPLLIAKGFAPRIGIAEGFVYRGALALGPRTIPIVHGTAVNLGAKLAIAEESLLALDWPAAQGLFVRFRDFKAGVEQILPNGTRYVAFDFADILPSLASRKSGELIGRSAEITILSDSFDRFLRGEGGLIVLSGPPGIGKSKVLDKFRKTVPFSVAAFWLRADPRRTSQHMSLWRDLLRPLVSMIARQKSDTTSQLAQILTAADIPYELQAVIDDVIPASGLPSSARLESLAGSARQDLLERAIVAIFRDAIRWSPLLLCLDDIEWFDDASLKLLARIVSAEPQLLLVVAHRANFSQLEQLKLAAGGRTTSALLPPLNPEHIAEIVRTASPLASRDVASIAEITDLSGGNPFHAEQIAHLFQSRLSKSAAPFVRAPIMPEAIDQVLDERLDGLSAPETLILRILSVFDRPIDATLLRRLAGTDDQRALQRLSSNAFVELGVNDGAAMKNRMLSQAVLSRIPPRELRRLHEIAARHVLSTKAYGQAMTVTDVDLANHWRAAGKMRRAAVAFGRAGDAALNAGALEFATVFYGQAIDALEHSSAQLSVRVAGWRAGSAVAHWGQGEMYSALSDAEAALALLDQRISGPKWLPRALRTAIARLRRIVLAPLSIGRHFVPPAVRGPLVTLSAIRAEMAFLLGDLGMMLSASASMVVFADEPWLRARARARAYMFLGYAAAALGLTKSAQRAWQAAQRAGTEANDPVAASHGHLGPAMWHMSFGRWQEAARQLDDASALYGDVADPSYSKFALTLFALAAYLRGDWQLCIQHFAQLQTVGEHQGNRSTQAWGLYGQAEAMLIPRRWHDADALLSRAEPIVASMPDRQSQIICLGLRAQIELGLHRHRSALAYATQGLAFARTLSINNFGSLEGFAAPAEVSLRLAAEPEAPAGLRLAASNNIKPAIEILRRFARAHPIAVPRLHLCKAIAARLAGKKERAEHELRAGLERAKALGMQFEQQKLERELARIKVAT